MCIQLKEQIIIIKHLDKKKIGEKKLLLYSEYGV